MTSRHRWIPQLAAALLNEFPHAFDLRNYLESLEQRLIVLAMRAADGTVAQAARLLGLRRMVDINLGRVFEQLEMLRAESRQMLQARAQAKAAARELPVVPPARLVLAERPMDERAVVEPAALDFVVAPPIDSNAYQNATTLAAHGLTPAEIAARCGLPAGEARVLASLASARARREQGGST